MLTSLSLGLSSLARGGAPLFLIQSLPTHVFSLGSKAPPPGKVRGAGAAVVRARRGLLGERR